MFLPCRLAVGLVDRQSLKPAPSTYDSLRKGESGARCRIHSFPRAVPPPYQSDYTARNSCRVIRLILNAVPLLYPLVYRTNKKRQASGERNWGLVPLSGKLLTATSAGRTSRARARPSSSGRCRCRSSEQSRLRLCSRQTHRGIAGRTRRAGRQGSSRRPPPP